MNSAKDDAAGLAISERMYAQVRGMNVAIRNANDGISLAQTAEGALGKVGDALQRMRELAVQAANGTNNGDDRDNLDAEYQQLKSEVERIITGAKFNDQALLSAATTFTFQVGAGTETGVDTIDVDVEDQSGLAATLGAIAGTDGSAASTEITALDEAIKTIRKMAQRYKT